MSDNFTPHATNTSQVTKYGDHSPETVARRAKATGAFHAKIARAFDSVGRAEDAKAARRAAGLPEDTAQKETAEAALQATS